MSEMNRRTLFLGAAGLASAGMLWGCVRQGATGEAAAAQRALLTTVSDLVIPATDTPGAVAAGVPAFVILALNHGIDSTRTFARDAAASVPGDPKPLGLQGLQILDWLVGELDARVGAAFASAPADRQLKALTALDIEAHADGAPPSPWRNIKDLILTGYYTSEIGASQELRYELVPGAWKSDVPLAPGDRAWSSDWTAVSFG